MRSTRSWLLSEAPVVASTIAGLTFQPELRERRFDVVLLDEAASIGSGNAVYAGSRADRTLALVGDFLQNAPIAEPADPRNEGERERAEWQENDLFTLAGIRDRGTARDHPRCVALQCQYRYPSIIADLVNEFCYDGLLESRRRSDPADGATITLVDTSLHADKERRQDGRSWYSPLGLDLLSAMAPRVASENATVGFVTPYKPQAQRAKRRAQSVPLAVECGTSHEFQGREFDAVIVDLMQDGKGRWVGCADLNGSKRERSAAKLLNVAVTRARNELFLIGDWNFIRRSKAPGMRALAALGDHPNFQVVTADQVLSAAGKP